MKTISQDTPFGSDIITASGGVKYALVNKRETKDEDEKISYVADMIEIKANDDVSKIVKHHNLNSIVTSKINGNKFYADDISRADMMTLLLLKISESIDNDEVLPTKWGCVNGIQDNVTFGDIKLALADGLSQKGTIVGVSE